MKDSLVSTVKATAVLVVCTPFHRKCKYFIADFACVVPEMPILVENPVNITEVVLLDGFNITCEATGNPEPTYYWYKDGILAYRDTGSELSISEAKPSDRGYYYCEARNDGGNSTSKSGLVLIQGMKVFTSQCTVCERILLFKGYFSVKQNYLIVIFQVFISMLLR